MIRRTFDPAFLNEVINHPEVRPWLGGEGPIDVTPTIANPLNFALVTDGGGFLLVQHEPGIYEVHSQFLPEARRSSVAAMRAGFDYMFARTDCDRLVTKVPDNNKAAAALAAKGGFRLMFSGETPRGPTSFMGLTIEEWAQGNPDLEADGEWFHDTTSNTVKAVRPDLPDHPEDVAHNRAVGAAVRMIRAGNVSKGVNFYNRWARLAGYSTISTLSEQPVVLNMSENDIGFVVEVRDGEMEVLLCR